MPRDPENKPLTSGDVAHLFNVGESTVAKWADSGHLPCFTTPGGHRRFRRADVEKLLGHSIDDGQVAS